MLENRLKTHMAIYECNMLMQDHAPCHHSKSVSNLFKKKNIKTFDCPVNSSDLNLIENLWAILKDKVANEHPTSAKDPEMKIERIWTQKITAEYYKHLMHSMLCRLQAVIKNKREHTKY